MPRQLPTPTPPSRYSYKAVIDEIAAELNARNQVGLQKQVAAAAGLDESAFSHRMNVHGKSRFTVDMIGCIADALDMPPGWPFIPKKRKGR